jgi:hypothetical protein
VYSEYNQIQQHSIKSKESFAVEAGSGPRHLTFSRLCLCTGTYWRSDGLSYSKGKLRKGSNNYFSERVLGTFWTDLFLTENFIYLKPWGSEYQTFRILKRKGQINCSLGKDHGIFN